MSQAINQVSGLNELPLVQSCVNDRPASSNVKDRLFRAYGARFWVQMVECKLMNGVNVGKELPQYEVSSMTCQVVVSGEFVNLLTDEVRMLSSDISEVECFLWGCLAT